MNEEIQKGNQNNSQGNGKNNNLGNKKLLNVRDISDYLYCARKVYLRKILGARERPNAAIIKGMIRHDILDELNKTESNIVSGITRAMNLTELGDVYKTHLLAITKNSFNRHEHAADSFSINQENFWLDFWRDVREDMQLRIKAISKLLNKNIFGYELWQKLEPKYLTEFRIISDKLQLVGRIDRIEIHKHEGKMLYIPCEIKNASIKEPYESDILQLASYAVLLEDKFNARVHEGVIQYKNKKIKIKIDEEKKKRISSIIKSINEFSAAEMPKILENFNKCRHCGLRDECFKAQ